MISKFKDFFISRIFRKLIIDEFNGFRLCDTLYRKQVNSFWQGWQHYFIRRTRGYINAIGCDDPSTKVGNFYCRLA
jgi:hypothetical protein